MQKISGSQAKKLWGYKSMPATASVLILFMRLLPKVCQTIAVNAWEDQDRIHYCKLLTSERQYWTWLKQESGKNY